MDDLISSLKISAAGMKVQGTRLRVISENLANADSLPTGPGKSPYRRKNIQFQNVLNRELGLNLVKVKKIGVDKSEFNRRFDPGHPAADEKGYVQTPNVKTLIEVMDMREAQRSYEANLTAIRTARSMMRRTIDLLRR
ncbi:MAG TPA: flagellar basal body rod protein FlgC [Rhodospirillales bacterium]|nr:flagellar basal body rod protein FlgC [Rhodospirillaceae bacterium]HHZ75719.1 flagellar basal body rod protein FlgC [Rhodospirillales bacterium]HIA80752.1 flagellar basal body rod protein FlgC [Rhodospirillales bacterium]HIB22325.1 flagellar basal body rod protein FlgC [Rhodospirillales bacterium]HIC59872.1 flagellar basal body rod protein FlgC [Rhodospirillales bacterium]